MEENERLRSGIYDRMYERSNAKYRDPASKTNCFLRITVHLLFRGAFTPKSIPIATDYDPDGDISAKANPVTLLTGRTWPMSEEAWSATWGLPWTISNPTSPDCGCPIGRKSSRP
jgi:hypothetical protein